MNEFLVITAIGEDRPGLVNDLSLQILNFNLNLEDSRMSVLGGEFAVILLVSGSTEDLRKFHQGKQQLEQTLQLNLLLKSTHSQKQAQKKTRHHIKVIGMDHPGIVHNLARFLSKNGINIEQLETESYPAPHTGTPMFAVSMTVGIPDTLAIETIRDDFSALCDEKNLDVDFALLET